MIVDVLIVAVGEADSFVDEGGISSDGKVFHCKIAVEETALGFAHRGENEGTAALVTIGPYAKVDFRRVGIGIVHERDTENRVFRS